MDFKSICQNKTKNDWAKYSLTKLFLDVLFVNVCGYHESMLLIR